MRPFKDLGPAARLYVSTVILLGLAFVPLVWQVAPVSLVKLPELIYLGIGIQIGSLMPVTSRGRLWIIPPLLIATGLETPGAGVAIVAWLCLFDGRLPGKQAPWWALLFNRAMTAVSYGVPSLLLPLVHAPGLYELPLRTLMFAVAAVCLNYSLMGASVVLVNRLPISRAFTENIGVTAVRSMLLLCLAGGVLYAVLQVPGGFLLAPVFWGLLFAVRANIGYAEQQAQERLQTLQLAAQALDARDPYTESHSERVAQMAVRLGHELGLPAREIERLRTAASLHDIGKIGIRDHILNKAEALTNAEWEVMKRHPDIGADMIGQHSALAPLAPAVRHHHERWNGTGYPHKLREDEIPLGARIIAVADGFDTVTSVRSYRHSVLQTDDAVENITRLSGKWYDPQVVDALRAVFGFPRLQPVSLPESPPFHPVGAFRLIRLHPSFGLLAAGMSASSIGDPLTIVATQVTVFSVTHQPLAAASVFVIQAVATMAVSALLGGVNDRLDRRRLIVALELTRSVILVATPFLIVQNLLWLLLVVFLLAAINAIVQPAKQAAIPELVDAGQVGPANAVITGLMMVGGAIGFPLAGAVIWLTGSPRWLFWADALTFAIAALLVLGLPNLGGGRAKVRVSHALRRAWSIRPARIYLVVTAVGVFLISMSYPAQIVFGYTLSPARGPAAYTVLQTALATGVVAGSIVVGRLRRIGTLRTAAVGLLLMGVFSVGIGFAPTLAIASAFMFLASFGNPIYSVASQTALLEVGNPTNRGSLMTTRFGVGQSFLMMGALVGGAVAREYGPRPIYVAMGVGLLGLALAAALLTQASPRPSTGFAAHSDQEGRPQAPKLLEGASSKLR